MFDKLLSWLREFQSTPSARRATGSGLSPDPSGVVSIHALREEGDHQLQGFHKVEIQFQSTPSARRATSYKDSSIHSYLFQSTPSARRAT